MVCSAQQKLPQAGIHQALVTSNTKLQEDLRLSQEHLNQALLDAEQQKVHQAEQEASAVDRVNALTTELHSSTSALQQLVQTLGFLTAPPKRAHDSMILCDTAPAALRRTNSLLESSSQTDKLSRITP